MICIAHIMNNNNNNSKCIQTVLSLWFFLHCLSFEMLLSLSRTCPCIKCYCIFFLLLSLLLFLLLVDNCSVCSFILGVMCYFSVSLSLCFSFFCVCFYSHTIEDTPLLLLLAVNSARCTYTPIRPLIHKAFGMCVNE